MKPAIGITTGDINGIGTEILVKSFSENIFEESVPVLVSPHCLSEYYSKKLPTKIISAVKDAESDVLNILTFESENVIPDPGVLTSISGKAAMNSIENTIRLCLDNKLNAMVTLPISKEAVNLAGYNIPGHTEFLADKTNTDEVLMMLVNDNIRVSLVTNHLPLKSISSAINQKLIIKKADILNTSLREDFGISNPEIAVFGLNPHAGDGGYIGTEEIEVIKPALQLLKNNGIKVHGPFPADGFFGQKLHLKFDGILAMYHDQGLAPFKLLSFGSGVNFTAGLPIIRTSPDHGTGFDIAGKGIASPSSFLKAYKLASQLAKKRMAD